MLHGALNTVRGPFRTVNVEFWRVLDVRFGFRDEDQILEGAQYDRNRVNLKNNNNNNNEQRSSPDISAWGTPSRENPFPL